VPEARAGRASADRLARVGPPARPAGAHRPAWRVPRDHRGPPEHRAARREWWERQQSQAWQRATRAHPPGRRRRRAWRRGPRTRRASRQERDHPVRPAELPGPQVRPPRRRPRPQRRPAQCRATQDRPRRRVWRWAWGCLECPVSRDRLASRRGCRVPRGCLECRVLRGRPASRRGCPSSLGTPVPQWSPARPRLPALRALPRLRCRRPSRALPA
jgi:hypothetical protein